MSIIVKLNILLVSVLVHSSLVIQQLTIYKQLRLLDNNFCYPMTCSSSREEKPDCFITSFPTPEEKKQITEDVGYPAPFTPLFYNKPHEIEV